MQQSFTKNYLSIYFFQALSIMLGFLSLFIVVPSISSNHIVYGIYTVCTSITIFLSYADLGFLGAGAKYAAECYVKNDKQKEVEIIGFTHFVLLVVVVLISIVFFILSLSPSLLIKDIHGDEEYEIAQKLLLILAIFSPVTVLQRMVQMIYNIRLQDYKVQRIVIIGNGLKILSVFYFFGHGRYDIVGYYLFFNVVNLFIASICCAQAKSVSGYSIFKVFKKLKFNKGIYLKVKDLAFSSLFSTICWIIFYEFDSVVIGRTLGAEAVAIYAIGLTLLGFVRSLLGVFFSPFAARFNHFIAQNNEENFNSYYSNVIKYMLPIVVLPLLSVALLAKPIVLSWVGEDYVDSIPVVIMLILCNILAFIQYPASNMLIAKEKIKKLYFVSAISPIVFWMGVACTIKFLGVYSFSLFKLLGFIIGGLFYTYYTLEALGISLWSFTRRIIIPYIPSIITLILIVIPASRLFCGNKSSLYLLYNGLVLITSLLFAFIVAYFTVKDIRDYVKKLVVSIFKTDNNINDL